jgi:hypothetical protein
MAIAFIITALMALAIALVVASPLLKAKNGRS